MTSLVTPAGRLDRRAVIAETHQPYGKRLENYETRRFRISAVAAMTTSDNLRI
jgi:hypothetical protein